MNVLIVDALARGRGERRVTLDVIGVGPRAVAGILIASKLADHVEVHVAENILRKPSLLRNYDIMMVSAMSTDIVVAGRLAKIWHKQKRGPAIIGGPITTQPKIVKELGYDYGIYGEAEDNLPKLVSSLIKGENINSINGIISAKDYRKAVKEIKKIEGKFVARERLNYLHPPLIENYPFYWASRVYVEVVRGCSNYYRPLIGPKGKRCLKCPICFKPSTPLKHRLKCPVGIPAGCGYCSVPALYGPARSRNRDIILREIKLLIDKGASRIVLSAPDILDYGRDYLVDPEPLTDPCKPQANTEALRDLFKSIWNIPEISSGEVYVLLENIKACLVNEDVARVLGEFFGNTPVHIGVESGDDNHLRMLGRPSLTKDVERAVRLLVKHGIEPYLYFIYGLPGETKETVMKTIAFIDKLVKLGARKITAYRFQPLPGTAFEDIKTRITKYSLMIKEKAEEVNRELKRKLLGLKTTAIIAGYKQKNKMLVAYPLPHGPVVLVHGPRELIGWRIEVKIIDVVSDREVLGIITSKIRKVSKNTLNQQLARSI